MKLFLVLSFCVYSVVGTNYCHLSCDGEPHTICARHDDQCGPSSRCGEHVYTLEFGDKLRLQVTDQLNYLRNKVATGHTSRPAASNMHKVIYDLQLERIAQCWTNNCKIKHDKCRITEPDQYVAQNIASFPGVHPKSLNISNAVMQVIDHWFKEIDNVEKLYKGHGLSKGEHVDNFYRMVWAKTKTVGCGLTAWKDLEGHHDHRKEYKYFLVCNFGPGGLLKSGAKVYALGSPASECHNGEDHTFPGLCKTKI